MSAEDVRNSKGNLEAGTSFEQAEQLRFANLKNLVREAWSGDYAIVGHDGDPLGEMFGEPREHMQYTVSIGDFLEMDKEAFDEKLTENPLVILIQCMDKRGAQLGYDHFRGEMLESEGVDPDQVNILHLAVGGGVIQRDVVVQGGEDVHTQRAAAFEELMDYVAEKADVRLVVATDHDHRCGAEAFAADGEGWPERLGCDHGASEEQKQMRELIAEFSQKLLPEKWHEDGIVRDYLVSFSDDPENEPFVTFIPARE